MSRIFTIGYEQATQAQMIDALKAAGVSLVIDVRAVAASRRPGFSKTILAASLKDEGIDYVHLKALGTPKAGREAARAGRIQEMHAIYEDHLTEPEAAMALAQAADLAVGRPSALLCYEADPAGCHRRILTDRLAREPDFQVVDLLVST